MNAMFVKTKSGVANVANGKTVLASDDRLVVLDKNCHLILNESGDQVGELFDKILKAVKPEKGKCLMLESGSWIHASAISNAFISGKSGALLITAMNSDNLLAMFTPEEYSDLDGLRDAIVDALIAFSEGSDLPTVNWSEYR
ncbi:hypothetical protein MOU92_003889 [Vibrio parahaemolyticus]|uniref:hypothetical protein n=1 Tax=Vibrio parahaemolyticus TaxID=670 RepID=UPI0004D65E07|nr:hypothetical protein [Vibrio parahaemolyticus]EIZ1317109.1 hypothetical protein [Vibrio parahaemolyticus]KOE14613.1 hypothetical protein ACS90_17245 [Vibrio parahaemolyticus]KOE15307.1 hypothetical protein ACS89_13905 [Vibrio parahaemolyticus]KOF13765.1 hypothetical protein ACX16_22785 [Vibrio parahaemolyticus]OQU50737.1 hypothetical protein EM74_008590 [Vibrio parahaemolyticus]